MVCLRVGQLVPQFLLVLFKFKDLIVCLAADALQFIRVFSHLRIPLVQLVLQFPDFHLIGIFRVAELPLQVLDLHVLLRFELVDLRSLQGLSLR